MVSVVMCTECGHRNAAGTKFCGKCESFLEWEDSPAETPSVAGPEPAVVAEGPKALRPDQTGTRHASTEVVEEPRQPGAGEIACRSCGIGNASDRRFCRACKAPLAEEVASPKVPWWRRLLRFVFLKRTYQAGHRRQVVGNVRVWPLVALLLAILLVSVASVSPLRSLAGSAYTAIRDRTSPHVAVTPVAARASSAAPGRQPALVYDGVSNRYWAPSGAPEGAWIELSLARPVRLLDVILTGGISAEKREFLLQGRPREVEVSVRTSGGGVQTKTITLQDEPGGQHFAIKVSDAVQLRLTIRSAYGMGSGHLCALAEVEIFARG